MGRALIEPGFTPMAQPVAPGVSDDVNALTSPEEGYEGDAPPLPAGMASELFGHLTEAPIQGQSMAEIDAEAEARKQAVVAKAEAGVDEVTAELPQASPVVQAPPTRASLAAELEGARNAELEQLDAGMAKALAEIDARITDEEMRLKSAGLDGGAVGEASGSIDAQAGDAEKAVADQAGARAKARADEARAAREANIQRADEAADAMVAKGEVDASLILVRGTTDAAAQAVTWTGKIADLRGRSNAAMSEASFLEGARLQQEAAAAEKEMAAALKLATDRAAREAEQLRKDVKRQADKLREEARAEPKAVTKDPAASPVEAARAAGVEKIRADADKVRGKQDERTEGTLADLRAQREAMASRLAQEVAGKKQAIEARVAAARQKLEGGGDLGELAAGVKATTGQIDAASDQLDAAAQREVKATTQRLEAKTAMAVQAMKGESTAALARIEAEAKAARAQVAKASAKASDAQRVADDQADAAAHQANARATSDLDASIARRQAKVAEETAAHAEAAHLEGMSVEDREAYVAAKRAAAAGPPPTAEELTKRVTQINDGTATNMMAQARTGNPDTDTALLRMGLGLMDPAHRAEAVAKLPAEQQVMAQTLLRAQEKGEALRKVAGDPAALQRELAQLSPGDRVNALAAAGSAVTDQVPDDLEHLSHDEQRDLVRQTMAGGRVDPKAAAAAFVGLGPAERAELGRTFAATLAMPLEQLVPATDLPNEVLSPEGMAAKLQGKLAQTRDGKRAIHDWVANLPAEQREAALAALPPEQFQAAQTAAKTIDAAAQLRSIGEVDPALEDNAAKEAKTAHDARVAEVFKGKSPAERNALLVEMGGKVAGDFGKLTPDELLAATEALTAAKQDGKVPSPEVFAGMSPAQQHAVSAEYERATGKKLEEDFRDHLKALPAGALTLSAQVERDPSDLVMTPGAFDAGLSRDATQEEKDAAREQAQAQLFTDLQGIAAKRGLAAVDDLVDRLPAEQQRQARLMLKHGEDIADVRKAVVDGAVDFTALDSVMSGRSPTERRAILAAAGVELPKELHDSYTKMNDRERDERLAELQAAVAGGKVSPDRVAHALDGLDPDQQQELRYRFQRETGTALGDDLAKVNAEELLPEALREKNADPEETRKAASALFVAMDSAWGDDEAAVLNNLRGKSAREIEALEKEYARLHDGRSLRAEIASKLSGEERDAAMAFMRGDQVEGVRLSLKYAARGCGTDETLMKDTLASVTDPMLRKDVDAAWTAQGDGSLDGMVKDELDDALVGDGHAKVDYLEAQASMEGNAGKAAAARALAALNGSNEPGKLEAELEKLPDARARAEFKQYFRELSATAGEDIVDFDARVADDMNADDRKVAERLAEGKLVEAASAKYDRAANDTFLFFSRTDEKAMFDVYEKPPAGWHGSAAEWRKRVTQAHDAEAAKNGTMTMAQIDADELGELDQERIRQDRANGKMDDVFAVTYATKGWTGNDTSVLLGALKRPDGTLKTKKEMAELRASFKAQTGKDLDEVIEDETGGRMGLDCRQAAKGEPEGPAERLENMRERTELAHSGALNFVVDVFTDADENMDKQYLEAAQAAATLNDPHATPEAIAAAKQAMKDAEGRLTVNDEELKTAQDQVVAKAQLALALVTPGLQGSGLLINLIKGPLMGPLLKAGLLGDSVGVEDIAAEGATAWAQTAATGLIEIATRGAGKAITEGLKAVGMATSFAGGALKLANEVQGAVMKALPGILLDPDVLSGKKNGLDVLMDLGLSVGTGLGGSKLGGATFGELKGSLGGIPLDLLGGALSGAGGSAFTSLLTSLAKGTSVDPAALIVGMLTSVGGGIDGALETRHENDVDAIRAAEARERELSHPGPASIGRRDLDEAPPTLRSASGVEGDEDPGPLSERYDPFAIKKTTVEEMIDRYPYTPAGELPEWAYHPSGEQGSAGRTFYAGEPAAPGEAVNYPPRNGAAGEWRSVELSKDQELHRFGHPGGRFLGDPNDPWGARALPSQFDEQGNPLPPGIGPMRGGGYGYDEYFYRVAGEGHSAQQSEIAPAFDQPGGGTQWMGQPDAQGNSPRVQDMVKAGILSEEQANFVRLLTDEEAEAVLRMVENAER